MIKTLFSFKTLVEYYSIAIPMKFSGHSYTTFTFKTLVEYYSIAITKEEGLSYSSSNRAFKTLVEYYSIAILKNYY